MFDRYEREIVPLKAQATQRDYIANLKQLKRAFGTAPADAVTPQHVAQYRDKRSAKVRGKPRYRTADPRFQHGEGVGLYLT